MARTFGYLMISIAALGAVVCSSQNAFSQIRPTIIDGGEVKETKPQPVHLERRNLGAIRASKATYGILVVLTSPKDAAIEINGKPEGKALDGRFKRELPLGKKYAVAVSAGPDYTEFHESVELKSRDARVVEAPLTSKYGIITVFPAKDKLKLMLDGQPIPPTSMSVDKTDNTITINKIAAGTHKVTYDLPGYVLNERTFDVSPGSELDWKLEPEKAISDITVVTEPGASVYVDGEEKGTTPSDGRLTATQIYFGDHEVKVAKDGFKQFTQTVKLAKEPAELAVKLEPIPTSAEFSDDFDVPNSDKWAMPPAGFSIKFDQLKNGKKNGRLYVKNASVIGAPAKTVYRGFYMNFDLKLVNAGGAAWAVRAKDSNNYYLFYLSGNDGLYGPRFLTYIVKDGKFDPSKPTQSDAVPIDLKAGDEFAIHVEGSQNVITQTITPAKNGETINLGAFKDPGSTFLYGGIGFRTVGKEEFSIDDLFVGPTRQN
jgi:hypothetical protein